jgi:hypothetical protein
MLLLFSSNQGLKPCDFTGMCIFDFFILSSVSNSNSLDLSSMSFINLIDLLNMLIIIRLNLL